MKIMKLTIVSLIALSALNISAKSLSGTVSVEGVAPKGTLYIFAKKFGSPMPMPLAVKRIDSPKYPVNFKLDESNKMMKNLPFKGPFSITARISPSGSAMDKSGVEAKTSKPIELGTKNIQITIKATK
ncbi:hypothetical protein [Halobacteriovorax sp.]|uniref:c-type cytochrome biogenesis protein CcmI/CycH n=1 Tax=Halobacteriovorax sp. TaxID=2020862 RepID=UPI0035654613